jgi:amidase
MDERDAAEQILPRKVSRRRFLRASAAAAAGASLAGLVARPSASAATPAWGSGPVPDLEQVSIAQLQAAMAAGTLTARALVCMYLARIEALSDHGPKLNAILEINPDAKDIASALDRERRAGHVRGPLHGIPILLKDNIDTADHMMTAAGSLAIVGAPPAQDSTVAAQLRAAGAILLGKTNMSEWANFRSSFSSSGWCGRNGQSRNPYVLDRNPCGSSSGSGIAAAAALSAASIGTETDGSIVCPANANGVVGIKPSVGLVSRAGVVPISHSQDTVGPHARSVADAAAVLTAIATTTADPRDPATVAAVGKAQDYTLSLDPNGLKGARIGVARNLGFGASEKVDPIMDAAIQAMKDAGAIIVDPANIPSDQAAAGKAEFTVLLYEFKNDVNKYLATRSNVALDREGFPLTLQGLIDFNNAHRDQELKWFGQDLFLAAEAKGPLTDQAYLDALAMSQSLGGPQGIDAVMSANNLDALIAPTGPPAWPIDLINGDHFVLGSASPAAQAGYPIVNVPAGFSFGLPVGISFIGGRFSEPKLIKLAFAFEQATKIRQPPQFTPTLPLS